MSSNEHPDMSGNPMDAPFLCDLCGKEYREEDAWSVPLDDEHFFCSNECANDWLDQRVVEP